MAQPMSCVGDLCVRPVHAAFTGLWKHSQLTVIKKHRSISAHIGTSSVHIYIYAAWRITADIVRVLEHISAEKGYKNPICADICMNSPQANVAKLLLLR